MHPWRTQSGVVLLQVMGAPGYSRVNKKGETKTSKWPQRQRDLPHPDLLSKYKRQDIKGKVTASQIMHRSGFFQLGEENI
jgi:hypothetical protein